MLVSFYCQSHTTDWKEGTSVQDYPAAISVKDCCLVADRKCGSQPSQAGQSPAGLRSRQAERAGKPGSKQCLLLQFSLEFLSCLNSGL